MTSTPVNTQVVSTAPQPQIVIIKEERESFISRGIGNIASTPIAYLGGLGFLAGGVVGVMNKNVSPLFTALLTGSLTAAIATLGVAAIQSIADIGVKAVIFAIKLPFRIVATVITKAPSLLKRQSERVNNLPEVQKLVAGAPLASDKKTV